MKKAALTATFLLLLLSTCRQQNTGTAAPTDREPVYSPVLNTLAFTYFTRPATAPARGPQAPLAVAQ